MDRQKNKRINRWADRWTTDEDMNGLWTDDGQMTDEWTTHTYYRGNIVTIRADCQQGMKSVSQFKMNTVTENYRIINTAVTLMWDIIFTEFI